MNQQTFDLRHSKPIVIETAQGLIQIDLVSSGGHKKVRLTMPDDMVANLGRERTVKQMKFFSEVEGRLVPKFRLLAASVDELGGFVGLSPPTALTLERKHG